jgi:transposase-like protein
MRYDCPNCRRVALRRRGTNLLRNVRRRERGDLLDRYICEACGKSFDESEVDEESLLPDQRGVLDL